MKFSAADYLRAVAEYDRLWRLADEALYRLCREHPGHDPASVRAKLLIVGRSYATGIERTIRSNGTQANALTRLAEHFDGLSSGLDRLLHRLASVAEPLTTASLRAILDVHGQLVAHVRPLTRAALSPRSFASKYLHFHCPAVPIFDSFVQSAIPKLVRWQDALAVVPREDAFDREYWSFAMRFWNLYQTAMAEVQPPSRVSTKGLDYYLYYLPQSETSTPATVAGP